MKIPRMTIEQFTIHGTYLEWRQEACRIRYQFATDSDDPTSIVLSPGWNRITLERRRFPGVWRVVEEKRIDSTLKNTAQYLPESLQPFVVRALEAVRDLKAEQERQEKRERESIRAAFFRDFLLVRTGWE